MTCLLSHRSPWLVALLLAVPVWATAAPHAHEHGVARLDVAVEPGRIILQLDTPLANLLGFERAPRTDTERASAKAVIATLKASATLFRIDAAAHCTLASVTLDSSALKLGQPDPAEAADGHADLDGSFEFNCGDATKAGAIDIGLFDAFPRLQRIESQVATPQGQFKRTQLRPARRLVLTKE